MEEEHAAAEPATAEERLQLVGLMLLFAVILWASTFLTGKMALLTLAGEGLRQNPEYSLYRKLYWAGSVSFFYTVPPALYCRYVMGLSLADLGLKTEAAMTHWRLYLGALALVMPLVLVSALAPHFQDTYPFYREAGRSLERLLIWEGAYAVQFLALEFFFRGVMIHAGKKVLGPWVILIMVLPYMLIHMRKPPMEAFGAILAGSALGVISYRTRVIYAGMLIHITVAWSMDLLSLHHRGQLLPLFGF